MKLIYTAIMTVYAGIAIGQSKPITSFHNCVIDREISNDPHYQDMSEIYKCDEGRVELKGRWSMTIEYETIFPTKMGRPDGQPHVATKFDYENFRWCSSLELWHRNQKELCGLVPVKKCLDGKPPTFDPSGDWSCAITIQENEKILPFENRLIGDPPLPEEVVNWQCANCYDDIDPLPPYKVIARENSELFIKEATYPREIETQEFIITTIIPLRELLSLNLMANRTSTSLHTN